MKKALFAGMLLSSIMGCAMSGGAVKNHNMMNVFYSEIPHAKAAGIVADMSKYCSSGIFDVEHNDLNNIGTSTVDLKVKNSNHYSLRVEIDSYGDYNSKVSVYHLYDTEVTRQMGRIIESWVVDGSKECVRGF